MIDNRPDSILIIDDEIAVLHVMAALFKRNGYQIIDTALTGEEGIEKLKKNAYDCILTDIKMPGMSGEEVLIQAKKITNNTIPVIAMSGTPWVITTSHFDAVLTKPISQQELFETINRAVRSTKEKI